MKTIIYGRYSTHKQDTGVSIANQLAHCKKYATYKGLNIVDTLCDEAISGGTNKGRPAFMELLNRIEQGDCEAVLVYDLTRLSREMLSLLSIERFCNEYGVTIHTTEGEVDTSSPEQFMAFAVKALFSEAERRSAKARTKKAICHMRDNGRVFTKSRYGWERVGDEFHEVPAEQKVIALVNEEYAKGATLADLQRMLKKKRIKTRNGSDWTPQQVKRLIADYEETRKLGNNELGHAIKTFISAIC